eukprot:CAMPEP_0195123540 /NCGR_PEP_ID=MMETSP0448-20130528/128844_1 /TAXON_ID=66468 /ORGANISM="Heterocapsa triquestra, Strain CCMP 448" /LENGTH=57 /DNA_ID=CAMNT_0040161097 /DNA_START=32 /DNA_END=202 /DNA_ORIENTATION=-
MTQATSLLTTMLELSQLPSCTTQRTSVSIAASSTRTHESAGTESVPPTPSKRVASWW